MRRGQPARRVHPLRGDGGSVVILIPHDMHEWDADDLQLWLTEVSRDPQVTPAELRLARRAANRAAIGQPPTDN